LKEELTRFGYNALATTMELALDWREIFPPRLRERLEGKPHKATLGKAYYVQFNITDVIVTERGDTHKSIANTDSAGRRIYFLAKNQFPLHPVRGNFASLNHTLLASAGQADLTRAGRKRAKKPALP